MRALGIERSAEGADGALPVIPTHNGEVTRQMSAVWSRNEWDQLEEVIVGNPLRDFAPKAEDLLRDTAADMQYFSTIDIDSLGADEAADLACEEVLAITRAVFETPLELDNLFAEAGGTSIAIARLARQLQTGGLSTHEYFTVLVIPTQSEQPLE